MATLLDGCDRRLVGHLRLAFVELQRELQVRRLVARETDRIYTRVAGGAVRRLTTADGRHEAFMTQIADTVGVEEFADLFQAFGRGNELRFSRSIDTVETRRDRRRTADAHMHFLRARLPNHLHD